MARFDYTAIDRAGKRSQGVIDAQDKRAAQLMLEKSGRIPVTVKESLLKASATSQTPWWKLSSSTSMKMGRREVLLFTEELADLLAAGMTLGDALNSLASREPSPETRVAADLRDRIIRGESLSDAVAAHPKSFPALYHNLIRAGEASGALTEVLHRLIEHYERINEMRGKIIQALTYPMIVLLMGIGTVVFAMVKVVPQFMTIFESMKVALPPTTKFLIASSHFFQKYLIAIIVVTGILCVLLGRAAKTPAGRRIVDTLKLKTPLIKGIVANGIYASFARTLQTLLSNGVTALAALKITEETVGNVVIAEELHHVRERVTDGTTISGPLAQGGVFPRMMTDLLAIGEKTGDLPSALDHIGHRYEGEMDRKIKVFTAALEPIFIVLVALVVGFIAISILSAVFKVTTGLGSGA